MRKLDRYLLTEMLGAFLFGIGAFIVILMSVDLLRNAFSLIFNRHLPALAVLQAMVYQMPQLIALVLPMATLFGVLMAVGRLSGEGEIVAMQAGGISFGRIMMPVVTLGLVVSLASLYLSEGLAPPANKASRELLASVGGKELAVRHNYTFQIPASGQPEKLVFASLFNGKTLSLKTVWVIELRQGQLWDWYKADSAKWEDHRLVMNNVVHFSTDGLRTIYLKQFSYDIGQAPADIQSLSTDLRDMSVSELNAEIRVRTRIDPNDFSIKDLRQRFHARLAIPWCALGFALLAAPLALRPQRTSAGIGLGISLAIILLYYVVFNLLTTVGQQGVISPLLAAWLPNIVLYMVGLGLVVSKVK